MKDKIVNFLNNHFNFKPTKGFWAVFLATVILTLLSFLFPPIYGYENGVIETVQMVVLFAMIALCATAKYNRRFFRYAIYFVLIIILREINCFRTVFYYKVSPFPIEGREDMFYPWKEIYYEYFLNITSFSNQTKTFQGIIKLGPIVHAIYGLFMGLVLLFFFVKKIFIDFWNILKKVKFPFWSCLLLLALIIFARICDTVFENSSIEETAELLMYVLITRIIWLYTRNKEYNAEDNCCEE